MAAVTASPPSAASPPSSKPLLLPSMSPELPEWTANDDQHLAAVTPPPPATTQPPPPPLPLSSAALAESPRLRQPPVSPVRVNFQPENWAQPSNVNIETSPGGSSSSSSPHTPRSHQDQPSRALPLRTVASLGDPHHQQQQQQPPAQSTQTPTLADDNSPVDSVVEVPALQFHHGDHHQQQQQQQQQQLEANLPPSASMPTMEQQQHHYHQQLAQQYGEFRSSSNPDLASGGGAAAAAAAAHAGSAINRHLTPTSYGARHSSLPRPHSAYSVYSDSGVMGGYGAPGGPRGRSPGLLGSDRAGSAHSRRSPDPRPSSYADMLNVPYPQPAPAPISLDNAQLRTAVGSNASLLSTQKTLEMYRQNVKKTNDLSIQYSFAVFLIATAQEQGLSHDASASSNKARKNSPKPVRDLDSAYVEGGADAAAAAAATTPLALVREARHILQRLANAGYPFAQYYLADGYASGLFSKGKEDYNAAFPLFVLAAKHGHAESAYRTALCYEFGWGCRRDPAKAVQYLRTAAAKRHPGAMTRLGKACLSGDLGEKRYREGLKWLKLATEAADAVYNAAPYQLGCLYETGYGDDIFQDESYAAELFTQAAELGHPDASYRMGDAYEHGKLNCPRDPALSVHFYTGAAERGHPAAMMGLCAWYMVGAEPLLEKDEEEAYEWARRSAELGYTKAQYAVGYFTEMGIGCRKDILEANVWYVRAADAGDERARQRLAAIRAAVSGGGTPMDVGPARGGKTKKHGSKDDNCAVM